MKKMNDLKAFVLSSLKSQLSEKLTYHGVHHTENVLSVCEEYISRMKIDEYEADLLRTAALFHDYGFTKTYDNHEEKGIEFMKQILPEWNYSSAEIEIISGMIRATKIPQTPQTTLEQIIADADLDYLGTAAFEEIGDTLYTELLAFNKIQSREQWDEIQLRFLEKHNFHTPFAQQNREPIKQKHYIGLKQKLAQ